MPYLHITTNTTMDGDQETALITAASRAAAEGLGKSEALMMVTLAAGSPVLFAGTSAPAAHLDLRSLGLPETNGPLCQTLCRLVTEHTGIPGDRIFVQFTDVARSHWGCDGVTFDQR